MKYLFLLFFLSSSVFAQLSYNSLNVKTLKLPMESVERAVYIDSAGQVKSSGISLATLNFLDATSSIQDQFADQFSFTQDVADDLFDLDAEAVKITGVQSISDEKTFTGKIIASSTTSAFKPCPSMTTTQRNALTPTQSDCIYNTTSDAVEFRSSSAWASASVPTSTLTVPSQSGPIWFGANMSSAGSITGNFGGSIISSGSCASGSHSATFTGLSNAPLTCIVQITSAIANIFAIQGLAFTSTTLTFTIRNDTGVGTCRNVHITCMGVP